jgi:predicted transcriptional regulator
MSHSVMIPDNLYQRLSSLATAQGQPVERVVADLLARELEAPEEAVPSTPVALDWESASAEDIIASVRASRVERAHPVEL